MDARESNLLMSQSGLSRRSALRLAGAGAIAAAAAPLVRPAAASAGDELEFSVGAPTGKTISKTDFGYNAPAQYTGLYHGTLPASDPRSQRTKFATALNDAGVGTLRFPGGTVANLYIAAGADINEEFNRNLRSLNPTEMRNGYLPDVWANGYYVELSDFLNFCQENGIEPLYSVNSCFYYDRQDERVWATTLNKWAVRPDGTVLSEVYDGERVDRAAAALSEHIDDLLSSGFSVKYWEIGNEEYLVYDYGRNDLDDGDDEVGRYAAVVKAFGEVIKDRIPESVVSVTGFDFRERYQGGVGLLEKLRENRGIDYVDCMTYHYPQQPGTANAPTGSEQSLDQFVQTDMQMDSVVQDFAGLVDANGGGRVIRPAVTEYKAYAFNPWNVDVNCTVANALVWANGAGELIYQTDAVLNVKHDFESSFWGTVIYNCVLDSTDDAFGKRSLAWIGPDGAFSPALRTAEAQIPSSNWFGDQYFLTPQARASKLLSASIGARALTVTPPVAGSAVSLFAAMRYSSGRPTEAILTFVNRSPSSHDVAATLTGRQPGEQPWRAAQRVLSTEVMRAGDEWGLEGILPAEYIVEAGHAQVSAGRLAAPRVRTRILPYSVTQARVEFMR